MNLLLARAFVGCCVLMALMGLALPVGCELKRGGRDAARHGERAAGLWRQPPAC